MLERNLKVGVRSRVVALGFDVIIVSGTGTGGAGGGGNGGGAWIGFETSQLYPAGDSSSFPELSIARTWKVWAPSPSPE